jgi:hypothetical protein
MSMSRTRVNRLDVRLPQDIVLYLLLLTTDFGHSLQARHATHTTSQARANLGRMHILVEFVGVGDTRHVQRFCGKDEGSEGDTIDLRSNIVRYTISASLPTSSNLSRNMTVELEGLGNENPGNLLELHEPLATLARPYVTFGTMLVLELLGVSLRDFHGLQLQLQLVDEFDFLVEYLLFGVITSP